MSVRRCSVLLAAATIALLSGLSARAEDFGGFPGGVIVGAGGAYFAHGPYGHGYYDYRRYREPLPNYRSYTHIAPPRYRERRVGNRTRTFAREGRRTVQRQLNLLGFNAGPADGVYGKRTRSAMAAFQTKLGERATGRLSGRQVAILNTTAKSGWQSDADTRPLSVIPANPDLDNPDTQTSALANTEAVAPVGPVFSPQGLPIERNRAGKQDQQVQAAGSHSNIVVAQQTSVVPVPTIDDAFVFTLPPGALPQPLPRITRSAGPFNSDKWRPKVFGITVGDSRAAVRKSLSDNGYRNCTEGSATTICTSSNQSLSDRISIAFSSEKTDRPAFLVRRILSFNKPVGRAFLERQMAGRYPRLLAESDGTISSSETCKGLVDLKPGSAKPDSLQALFSRQESKAGADSATLDLLEACPDFFAVAFDGEDKVSHVEIVIFDATSLRTRHLAELRQRRAERLNNEAISETLKF